MLAAHGPGAHSFVGLLRSRAARQPDRRAYVFLGSDGAEESHLTYAQLDHQARRVAVALRETCVPGDRVLILHPPGEDYLTAFFGCLYAGAVAVPAYPPRPRTLDRLRAVVRDCAPAAALTGDRILASVERRFPDAPELRDLTWLPTRALGTEADRWTDPGGDTDGLAFLQYTSGSTAAPKGVMVTHGNLLHHSAQIQRRLGSSEDSCQLSWLPPFHDMGLIGGILHPAAVGFPGILMAPGTFVLDPVQWLRALSVHGVTMTPAPPFALDLCVERVDPAEHAPLDLSALESVVVGAEPVRTATLDRFAGHFARWGLRREALRPSFGLAEATLMVSCGAPLSLSSAVTVDASSLGKDSVVPTEDREPGRARTITGCGSSVDGQRLVVVDPATATVCGPERVGEIWVSGPNVARGYWERPEESEASFRAELATGEGPFMRTGDLGFLRDGELFVTGRSKDLLIVRGRNLYPQDVERCAESGHPALQANSSAAVGIDDADGTERLVLIAEIRRGVEPPPADEVARALVPAISAEFDVRLHGLVLVRAATVPKTSSGKIQRRAARQAFLDGTLSTVGRWTDGADSLQVPGPDRRTAVEAYVTDLVTVVAPESACRPGREQSLLDLGLDSLSTLRLVGLIERDLGVDVSDLAYGDDLTVAALAEAVVEARPDGPPLADGGGPNRAGGTESVGAVGLPRPRGADGHAGAYEPFPQTDTQQAYCLGRTDTFELGNVSTHAYLEFEAPGLDLPRFEQAWRRLIDRHEMLRSVMLPDTNEQRVLAEVPPYEIRVTDLRGRAPQEAETALAATRDRLSHEVRPADRWPLFEVAATHLDDGLRIHLSMDALIADFSSGKVLFRDLDRFYEDPDGAALPPLTASFRDYVRAGAEHRDGPRYRDSHDYWWSRLPALPPAPELPTAAPARSVLQPRFTRRDRTLPAEVWRGLKDRAARAGLTPTGLLLSVFAEVLAAWSGSRHFTVNVPRLNRPVHDEEFAGVVGQFASFTLLEVDHRAGGTFEDRARVLQRQLRADLRHQDVSGVEVLRELMRLQGGFDRALMPVVMTSNLAFAAHGRTPLEKLLEPVFSVSQTPQVSLDYQVQEDEEDGALLLNWDVVEELFPAGLVDAMFAAHSALLDALAADEGTWSRDAPLAPPSGGPGRGVGRDREVPAVQVQSLFLDRAAARPDAPAVIAVDRVLSYAELREAAERTGRWLYERGARPNQLVAVVMEKGWEQVVAAYGVLLSGAAYLPVDPELPAERIRHLLDRGEVSLILTRSHLDSSLDWPSGPERLCLDRPLPDTEGPLPADGSPDDLVYTMFTSGSTGEPKGVMVSHRALVNCVADTVETFGFGPSDRALAVTALHHDLSAFDLFGVLGSGGALVMPSAGGRRDPAHWAELVATHGVTVWNSVPAMMEMLLESVPHSPGGEGPLGSLRRVVLGGDWIPLTVPGRLTGAAPGAELLSIGGPTETTVWSIWYPVGEVDPSWRSIPYGTPVANVRYRVLDERLEECPDWVTGEMYVSGVCLADGYWRDAARTDAVFTAHPGTGERMYRTGDLGRWRPEGTIEFMGRADFQVKIHGQRIELGEIESVLLAHPDVASAVVTATPRADRPGHDGLAAYVVAGSGTGPTPPGTAEFEESRRQGIQLLDPVERAEFKLARHGLRREPDRPRVPLTRSPDVPMLRRSDRDFLAAPITLAELSDCLGLLRQVEVDGLARCRYPSAGGLYPVQAYLQVKAGAVTGLPAGAYYVDPREGALVALAENATVGAEVHAAHNRALYDAAGFSLFLVADRAAMEPLYGRLTRDLCLLEAGYMGQLLMDRAALTDVGLCPIGELSFEPVRRLLDLGDSHELVHTLVGGRVDRAAPARTVAPAEPLADRLRGWLRDRLPAHMVPDHVLTLDSWPLGANGKIDRRALPAPRTSQDATGFVAPRTPTEEVLAALWCELLDVERVGVQDNFFELGGHSLAATRLISRIRDRFEITIGLRAVFTTRTVADLATTVDTLRNERV
ncbi:amino acid adenylation domain-containing protein [Streptomyces sp. NPDC004980]